MTRLEKATARFRALFRPAAKRTTIDSESGDPAEVYFWPLGIVVASALLVFGTKNRSLQEFIRLHLPHDAITSDDHLITGSANNGHSNLAAFWGADQFGEPQILQFTIFITGICLMAALIILFMTLCLYLFSANEKRSKKAEGILKTMVKFLVGSLTVLVGALAFKIRSTT